MKAYQPSLFETLPKLKKFYENMILLPAFEGLKDVLPMSKHELRDV
jgi:hypothetical protein